MKRKKHHIADPTRRGTTLCGREDRDGNGKGREEYWVGIFIDVVVSLAPSEIVFALLLL